MTTDALLTQDEVQKAISPELEKIGYPNAKILVSQENKNSTILLQVNVDNQEQVQKLSNISSTYVLSKGKILEQSVIGASVGDFVKNSAVKAIIAGLIFIAIYMMFAFSAVRSMISPAILAIITIVTLVFDMSIPSGAYGALIALNSTMQIDLVFVAAILTIMGYSINDTIIVFDRVRENMHINENALNNGKVTYLSIFEDSIWQTMRRSLSTSVATLIMITMMWLFGTGIIKTFSYVIGAGIIAGTYSSMFLAAPLAYLCIKWSKKKA
ncbi:MAG: protein translocase subunit SecF [bacterium]